MLREVAPSFIFLIHDKRLEPACVARLQLVSQVFGLGTKKPDADLLAVKVPLGQFIES